ncbi:MAG: hypothetical protein A3F82_04835 [Deltaproteobacteria bacterium RIFCSPLOWO2_12_FULL_44_12]|nr:MAG: hypothetical protein A2712_05885 [Deltaproteobacteria bacterium RIFCSPHIGHO2_01_FULL_43_49]OGQ16661.1 MAG: hypothetical protein A3D22_07010 [Deltaproteobacteria bacterium RIFCSPHIGHO2_02_FULL_44_53]OGQ29799.1 MAG: hypothetical protein A3D98_09675 [Deltaproteobacteria bacterium RIFCSPHIGHO2_12_FULL_44_21]OGQ33089.1 MAG: hypothetical protein A2979_03655 [Deltaproteobacteria bacterium RIFCSPLOWO2_01_FULL_45_74]OGQ42184.1 MAG: hypothetical protein A3I70_05960 [Deltaproteobacteria bacterium 
MVGELLLVPIKENAGDLSVMYSANESGTRIWDLLLEKRSLDGIKKILLEEYDIEESKLAQDIESFVKQLVEVGALVVEKN